MSNTQKHTKSNVPNLRFPGFEGEWLDCTFGDCCTGFDYGMNAASTQFDGEHKYIRITDIDERTSEYMADGVVSPDAEIDEHYRVKENDILFARTWANTGKTYLFNPKDGRLYFAGFLIRMNVSPQNNSRFVFYQTQTRRYKKWVQIMSMRSGQPGINSQEYSSYRCFLPKAEEQRKIAGLLTLIDQRISIQKKVIEDLICIKESILNRMMNEKDESCRIVSLGEITEIISRRNKEKIDYPMYSVTNEKGFVPQEKQFEDREMVGEDISAYKIVHKEEIAYNPARINVGSIAQYTGDSPCMISSLYVCIKAKKGIDSNWLIQVLKSEQLVKKYNLFAEGGVRLYLFYPNFSRIKISLPSPKKQSRISEMIEKLEKKIALEQSILSRYLNTKAALLRDLFV